MRQVAILINLDGRQASDWTENRPMRRYGILKARVRRIRVPLLIMKAALRQPVADLASEAMARVQVAMTDPLRNLARISHQRFTESLSAEKAMEWRSLEKRKNRLLFVSAYLRTGASLKVAPVLISGSKLSKIWGLAGSATQSKMSLPEHILQGITSRQ
jgi:hypothetical protein